MVLGTLKLIGYFQRNGSVSPSSFFGKILHLKGTRGSGEVTKQRPGQGTCGQNFGQVCQRKLSRKKKHQWVEEKPKLDNE